MRIAFVTQPALGHLLPLLPLAVTARDAGRHVTGSGDRPRDLERLVARGVR